MYQQKYYKTGPNDAENSYKRFNVIKEESNRGDYASPLKTRQLSLRNENGFERETWGHMDYIDGECANLTGFHDDERTLRINSNTRYKNRSATEKNTWDYTDENRNFVPEADYFHVPQYQNISNYREQKDTDESDPRTHGLMRQDLQGKFDGIGNPSTENYFENDHQHFLSHENLRTKSPIFYTRPSNKIHASYLQRNEAETSFINDEKVTNRNQILNVRSNNGQEKYTFNPCFDGKNGATRRFSVDDTYPERRDSFVKQATNHTTDYFGENYIYANDTQNTSKQRENWGLSRENSAHFYSPSSKRLNDTDTTSPSAVLGIQQYKPSSMIPSEYSIYSPSVTHVDKTENNNSVCSFVLLILCSMFVLLNGIVDGYMNYQIGNLTCSENLHLAKRFNFNASLTDVCEKKDLVEKIVRGVYSLGSVLTFLQIVNIIIIVCHRVKLSAFSGMSGLAELQLTIWFRDIPQAVIALFLSFPCTCGYDSRLLVTLVIVGGFVVGWFRFLTSFSTFKGEAGCLNLWWRCLCCKESSRNIEELACDGSDRASFDVPCILCCFTWHLQKSKCRIQCWCFDVFKRLNCICTLCDKDRRKYGHRLMSLFGLTILTLLLSVQIITLL